MRTKILFLTLTMLTSSTFVFADLEEDIEHCHERLKSLEDGYEGADQDEIQDLLEKICKSSLVAEDKKKQDCIKELAQNSMAIPPGAEDDPSGYLVGLDEAYFQCAHHEIPDPRKYASCVYRVSHDGGFLPKEAWSADTAVESKIDRETYLKELGSIHIACRNSSVVIENPRGVAACVKVQREIVGGRGRNATSLYLLNCSTGSFALNRPTEFAECIKRGNVSEDCETFSFAQTNPGEFAMCYKATKDAKACDTYEYAKFYPKEYAACVRNTNNGVKKTDKGRKCNDDYVAKRIGPKPKAAKPKKDAGQHAPK